MARWGVVAGCALAAAVVAGAGVGLATLRGDDPPQSLVPVSPSAPVSVTPTPSVSASPSVSPSPSASRSPSPTPRPTTPPPTTPPRTTAPPATTAPPRTDVAFVRVENDHSGAVTVWANGVKWTLAAHGRASGEVTPRADHNDSVSMVSVDHPQCGQSDPGQYFQPGKHYRIVVTTAKGSCTVDGKQVDAPQFAVYPA